MHDGGHESATFGGNEVSCILSEQGPRKRCFMIPNMYVVAGYYLVFGQAQAVQS